MPGDQSGLTSILCFPVNHCDSFEIAFDDSNRGRPLGSYFIRCWFFRHAIAPQSQQLLSDEQLPAPCYYAGFCALNLAGLALAQ